MTKRRDKIVWNIKDILASPRVAIMSLEEEGAYRRSLDIFYLNGYLPSDIKELAKLIGKGCSLDTARVVKSMYKEDKRFINMLTHDYLEKIIDGEDAELVVVTNGENDRLSTFKSVCDKLKSDSFIVEFGFQRYNINELIIHKAIDNFIQFKLATGGYKSYFSPNDIRKNFINYIPYDPVVKQSILENNNANQTNAKSVTSKLQGWITEQ